AVKAAVVQYRNGLVDFNRVALLQENLVTQQSLLAASRGEIALGLIQTYKAIGGGWEIRNIGFEGPAPPQALPPPLPGLPAVDALRLGPTTVTAAVRTVPVVSRRQPAASPAEKPLTALGPVTTRLPTFPAVILQRTATTATLNDNSVLLDEVI